MKRAVALLLGLVCATVPIRAGQLIQGERPVKDRYIVVLKARTGQQPEGKSAPGQSVGELTKGLALFYGGKVERTFEAALQGSLLTMTERQAQALARDPRVAYVEQDREIPVFTDQLTLADWGLDRIDERDLPLNHHFRYTTTGAGVNAYILDTGIAAAVGSREVNAFSAIDDTSGNPVFGDCNGHGTAVAGFLANVAKDVTLNAVRIGYLCGTCGGTGHRDPNLVSAGSACGILLSDAIAGVNWVAAHRVKPAVANLSFGGSASQALDDAVTGMINAGVTVVVAAGNNGGSACDISPARVPAAITVGASDSSDSRAIFDSVESSNFGPCLDLFAPGKDLFTGGPTFSGTSGAAPLVAGAVARYLQSTPTATPSAAQTYIINNATTGRLSNIGTGSPNRLLFSPPGGPEIDNPPTVDFTYSCSGRTCTFTATATDDYQVIELPGWTFGDPYNFQPNSGLSISHTYAAAGSYSVSFGAYDDAFQSSVKTKIVTVP
jgi:subtilisin family serine protease